MTFHYGQHESFRRGKSQEHAHRVCHAILYVEGRNRFLIDGRKEVSAPGRLVLVSPETPHYFLPIDPGESTYHEITFALLPDDGHDATLFPVTHYLRRLTGFTGTVPDPFIADLAPGLYHRIDRLFLGLARAFAESEGVVDAGVLLVLAELFVVFSRDVLSTRVPGAFENSGSGSIEKVLRHIERHYAQDCDVDALAGLAGYSREHFCRKFKQETGHSPMAYRNGLRIAAAKSLLETSGLLCKEIADRLGFCDMYAFSRTFRRIAGVSPSDYRNGRRAGA